MEGVGTALEWWGLFCCWLCKNMINRDSLKGRDTKYISSKTAFSVMFLLNYLFCKIFWVVYSKFMVLLGNNFRINSISFTVD